MDRIMETGVNETVLRFVFAANVLVAGVVGYFSLVRPVQAVELVFQGTAEDNSAMGVAGSFWLAIAILSAVGLYFPAQMSVVLMIQLLYKGMWLMFFALPAYLNGQPGKVPTGIALFFAVWVVVLPFVIPFRFIFLQYKP
jgi:hypothetical protein